MMNAAPKKEQKKPLAFWLIFCVFGFTTFMTGVNSCLKEDYPFMVIGFPADERGAKIYFGDGVSIGRLTRPWIFTLEQTRQEMLPLTYRVCCDPEPRFVRAEDIRFEPPEILTDAYRFFELNAEQSSTFEGQGWSWDGEKVELKIAFDAGPNLFYTYRVQKGVVEPIETQNYGPCFISTLFRLCFQTN